MRHPTVGRLPVALAVAGLLAFAFLGLTGCSSCCRRASGVASCSTIGQSGAEACAITAPAVEPGPAS